MDAIKISGIQQVLIKAQVAGRDQLFSIRTIKMGIAAPGGTPDYILCIYKFIAAEGGHADLSLNGGVLQVFFLPYLVPGPPYSPFELGDADGF